MIKRGFGIILTFAILLVVLPTNKFLLAAGPTILYEFDNYIAGESAEELEIVTLGGEEGLKIDLNPVINDNVEITREDGGSRVATGWGKSLEITIGEWSLGDTWQPMWINIPEDKQDWGSHKYFGFWWNNQLSVSQDIGAFIVMFEDKDNELWGWKIPVQNSWSYIQTASEGEISLHWAGSDWQGLGHTNWYSNYISLKLDKELFELKEASDGGNGVFDLDQIQRVLFLVDCGPIGIREGDKMYFDDFFIAKTMVVANNKYFVDGVDIANRNEGKEPPATPTNIPTPQASPTNPPTPTPADNVTPSVSSVESTSEATSETTTDSSESEYDTSYEETPSPTTEESNIVTSEDSQPTSAETPDESSSFNFLVIIIPVIIILAALIIAFYIYKNRVKK